jgi:class 3 adenylate cyclase/CHASE2 domain-containing sensor protein
LRERLVAAAIAAVAAGLALALTRPPSPLASAERLVDALAFRLLAPERVATQIAVIGITEATLATLPYRSPIDRRFLAGLIDDLLAAEPAAIGIDILIDRPTEPEKDTALHDAMRRAGNKLVLITLTPDTQLPPAQRRHLEAFAADLPTGYANLARDRFDDMIRGHAPTDHAIGMHSFPAALAAAAGVAPPDMPFEIEWRPRVRSGGPFPIYPAETIRLLPKDWLRGKILLVGSLVAGADEHRTLASAFSDPTFGVEIHAQVLAQILDGRAGSGTGRSAAEATAAAGLALFGAAAGTTSAGWILIGALAGGALIFAGATLALYAFGWPLVPLAAPVLALLLAGGGARIWRGRGERRDRQALRQLFSRFVSAPVVDEILREREAFLKGGRPRPHQLVATVLFSDIAGFTPICESLGPEPLIAWLDRYIDTMVQCITDHRGVVLRFVGDGILAVFGAPIPRTSRAEIAADALAAARCALAMEHAMRQLNEGWRSQGLPTAGMRVGIHTGPLVAGSLGNGPHMEYCLLGDTANTASRLEQLGKAHVDGPEAVTIMVGDSTWRLLGNAVAGVSVGEVPLKGKRRRIVVHRIGAPIEPAAPASPRPVSAVSP